MSVISRFKQICALSHTPVVSNACSPLLQHCTFLGWNKPLRSSLSLDIHTLEPKAHWRSIQQSKSGETPARPSDPWQPGIRDAWSTFAFPSWWRSREFRVSSQPLHTVLGRWTGCLGLTQQIFYPHQWGSSWLCAFLGCCKLFSSFWSIHRVNLVYTPNQDLCEERSPGLLILPSWCPCSQIICNFCHQRWYNI